MLFALALVLAMAAAWWLVGKVAFLLSDPMYLDRELDFLPAPPKLRVVKNRSGLHWKITAWPV